MREKIELECLDCGHKIIGLKRTCDGKFCERCNGRMNPIRYAESKGGETGNEN